jgi:hypothetical protein
MLHTSGSPRYVISLPRGRRPIHTYTYTALTQLYTYYTTADEPAACTGSDTVTFTVNKEGVKLTDISGPHETTQCATILSPTHQFPVTIKADLTGPAGSSVTLNTPSKCTLKSSPPAPGVGNWVYECTAEGWGTTTKTFTGTTGSGKGGQRA